MEKPEKLWGGEINSLPEEFGDVLIVRVCPETVRGISKIVADGYVDNSGEVVRDAIISYTLKILEPTEG